MNEMSNTAVQAMEYNVHYVLNQEKNTVKNVFSSLEKKLDAQQLSRLRNINRIG